MLDMHYVPSHWTLRAVFPRAMGRAVDGEANGSRSSLLNCELNHWVASLLSSSAASPLKKESEHGPHRSWEGQFQRHVMWQSCSSLVFLLTLLPPLANWCHAASRSDCFSCISFLHLSQNPWLQTRIKSDLVKSLLKAGSLGRNSRHAWIWGHR